MGSTDKSVKRRIAHYIRWALELIVLWGFVFPETGPWTAFTLTMMTIGIEWDYLTGLRG